MATQMRSIGCGIAIVVASALVLPPLVALPIIYINGYPAAPLSIGGEFVCLAPAAKIYYSRSRDRCDCTVPHPFASTQRPQKGSLS